MSGSEQTPKEVMEEVFGATTELRVTEASGIKLLTGAATVQLVVTAVDVATPQEAVDVVVRDLFRQGINAFTFVVTDTETGEHFFVQDGRLITTREARETVQAREEAEGDPGDDSDSDG
jgi:hypothetical protein